MGLLDRITKWVKTKILREEEVEQPVEEPIQEVQPQTYVRQEVVEEQKVETPKVKKPRKEIVIPEEEEDALTRRVKLIRQKPKMVDMERHIGLTSVNTKEIPLSGNLSDYIPIYEKLISENAKITDSDVVRILVENRGKLKHRLSTEIRIYSSKGLAATLTLTGTLIEDGAHVVNTNLSEGDYVEYMKEKLIDMYGMAKRQFQALNDEESAIYIIEPYKVTVTKIEVETSFA